MTCEQATDLIVDSLMDALDRERQELLATHLSTCVSCAAEARAMGWTWDALGELEAAQAGPQAAADLGRRIAAVGSKRPAARWLRAAAAVTLLLLGGAGGYWLRGEASPAPARSSDTSFLLLVRGDQPDATVPEETLVREYGAWAASLAEDGRLVAGEKLTDDPGRWISAADETRTRSDVSGYFVVTASDYAQAVAIARGSPHVRYGGTFEVRQIDSR
jgi:hypothetical protein